MIRPALTGTVAALRRALRSAGVATEELDSVLLVGGASRTPVVAQLVTAELDRPVAVDTHPKHAVALGAAHLAARQLPGRRQKPTAPGPAASAPTAPPAPAPTAPSPTPVPAPSPAPAAPPPPASASTPVTGRAAVPVRSSLPVADEPPAGTGQRPRRWPLVLAGVVTLAMLATAGIAVALRGEPPSQPTLPVVSSSPTAQPEPDSQPVAHPVGRRGAPRGRDGQTGLLGAAAAPTAVRNDLPVAGDPDLDRELVRRVHRDGA